MSFKGAEKNLKTDRRRELEAKTKFVAFPINLFEHRRHSKCF